MSASCAKLLAIATQQASPEANIVAAEDKISIKDHPDIFIQAFKHNKQMRHIRHVKGTLTATFVL